MSVYEPSETKLTHTALENLCILEQVFILFSSIFGYQIVVHIYKAFFVHYIGLPGFVYISPVYSVCHY